MLGMEPVLQVFRSWFRRLFGTFVFFFRFHLPRLLPGTAFRHSVYVNLLCGFCHRRPVLAFHRAVVAAQIMATDG